MQPVPLPASSHTGSLAGADKAADALLKQSGVIREFSLQDLFNTAKVFSHCPIPKGNRVAIVTNSGGPGIMATDAVCEHGMEIAHLSDQTKETLRSSCRRRPPLRIRRHDRLRSAGTL